MTAAWRLIAIGCLMAAVSTGSAPCQEQPAAVPPLLSSYPFASGERLVYRVKWDPPWYFFFLPTMEAGELEVLMREAEYAEKKALRLSFKAKSSGTLVKMAGIKIDDEFIFFADRETLCSLSASKKIREGKRKRQIDVEYLRDSGQLHLREVDESVTPPKIKRDEIKDNIPFCVQDPISALYLLRASQLRPGYGQSFLIGHDDRIKEIRAEVDRQESVETPAGKTGAWRVNTAALMGGLFKDGGQFRLWISTDDLRLPLQFEIKVGLGMVFGKLEQRNP